MKKGGLQCYFHRFNAKFNFNVSVILKIRIQKCKSSSGNCRVPYFSRKYIRQKVCDLQVLILMTLYSSHDSYPEQCYPKMKLTLNYKLPPQLSLFEIFTFSPFFGRRINSPHGSTVSSS